MSRGLRRLAWLIVLVALAPPVAARLLDRGPSPAELPAEGRLVVIDGGLALNVLEQGQGPPVVLVHGLPSNAYDWGELPARLAALGHRVVAYDRIGYGYSSRPVGDHEHYTYASNASDLAALLDALGIEQAALVGWSYGGAVAQSLALVYPGRVTRLVLVGSVGPALAERPLDLMGRVERSALAWPLLVWIRSLPPLRRAVVRTSVADAFSGTSAIPAGWVERTDAMLRLPGTLDAYVTELHRGRPEELRPEKIFVPSLVVHGSDDRLVAASVGTDLARRLPRSEELAVARGSHMLPVTHPDLLARQIDDFLSRH
jgi:2-hydroxymuconate-semialdehyde hydrolase